jgi:transcription elongation factor GreB
MTQREEKAPVRSPYITAGGYQALRDELQALWERRGEVTRALAAAAAEGDRSENAEYIYRKKELRELDRRLRYLQKRLPELKVVSGEPADPRRVYFGAWVTLEDVDGNLATYRIVGADELDPKKNWISIDAPVARAALRRALDDEFSVRTPGGEARYCVVEIRYESVDAATDATPG